MNEAIVTAFGAGVLFGALITLVWATYFIGRSGVRSANPPVEVLVTPELADQIAPEVICEWLERRDLVVMPRGKEFTWPGQNIGAKKP